MGLLPAALQVRTQAAHLLAAAGCDAEAAGYRAAAADVVAQIAGTIADGDTRAVFLRTNEPG
jgi:hypothetical protein